MAAEIIDIGEARHATSDEDIPLSLYDDELAANAEFVRMVAQSAQEPTDTHAVTVKDFYAYMPTHQYLFAPTRALWPASSVNARCDRPLGADGHPATKKVPHKTKGGEVTFEDVPMTPAEWLDKFHPVELMTWAPGESEVIRDKLVDGGGWIDRPGCACFNLYRPPRQAHGEASLVTPWTDHVVKVYGEHADYIIRWLAHRVQHPGVKINHALVLGGKQGIGKDTILEPIKHAIGPWNFAEVTPTQLLGRFNPFVKSVILRISEARDLGDVDRFAFYEHTKIYTAAPPDVLSCDEKNLREHAVMNVTGVIITTNNKLNGLHLPADDRRHYVAWSDRTKEDFPADYWRDIYGWYAKGGIGHIAAHLAGMDLSDFDPKAPPPKTEAFHEIVNANTAPEDRELADILDKLGQPSGLTLGMLQGNADGDFRAWLLDRANNRALQHRLEAAGYVAVRSPSARDGFWTFKGKRFAMYARCDLAVRDRHLACEAVIASWKETL